MSESSPASSSVPLVQRRQAADWAELGVVCPACHGGLEDDEGPALRCTACGAHFPVTCGIPDLRTIGDPYLSVADDDAAARALVARDDERSFGALYASYYEGNEKVPPEQVARFTHGVLAAADRANATIDTWRELGADLPATGVIVDLGCGTAPLGVALAARGHLVIAVDAGLRWLVLARKRAAARGIDLAVVCANAEQLPLRGKLATAVVGESVLENLADADAAITEVRRVVQPHSVIAFTTPNRHSVGPDPHLGLFAGGWRSAEALRAHAERTGQLMPRRRLFTPAELSRALQQVGFLGVRMALPRFADAQRA
ncbi:MAG: methyltransferase domain-containing protein, partial [Gemmatimonadota bacterium]